MEIRWLAGSDTPSRYTTRGRFSKRRFEAECITEYAEVFPIVCGDFAFYQFPQPEFWGQLFGNVPATFQFALKVPQQITLMEFPRLPRYGSQGGQLNPSFLNAELLKSSLVDFLEPHRRHVAALIFEFGVLAREQVDHPERFLDALDGFLRVVARMFRLAVEIRNPELLIPAYFEILRRHRVAHVYTAWAGMPDLPVQMAIPGSRTADFVVCRALLRRNRSHEQAVKLFAPYSELREPYPPAREGLRDLVRTDVDDDPLRMIFVTTGWKEMRPAQLKR